MYGGSEVNEGAVEAIIASVSLRDGEDLMGRHAPPPPPPPPWLSLVRSCESGED